MPLSFVIARYFAYAFAAVATAWLASFMALSAAIDAGFVYEASWGPANAREVAEGLARDGVCGQQDVPTAYRYLILNKDGYVLMTDLEGTRLEDATEMARAALGLATLMWTVPGGAQETGGPYMRDPRHPRHFTDEFKRQIVDLYNAGKPKREIMDEYDLGKSTVERWIKSINATGSPRAADNRTPEQNRILELERENRRLRMEVDVLKQAALIYARK